MGKTLNDFFPEPVRMRIIERRTKILEQLAKKIRDIKLLSVECRPDRQFKVKECFLNVESKVKQSGGKIVGGWIFNEYENIKIQAEAHAIWEAPFGRKLIDVTPHMFQPERVLFLPDDSVLKKRGYTFAPRYVLTTDSNILAIEQFDEQMSILFDANFKKMGEMIEIEGAEIEAARLKAGISHDLSNEILNRMRRGDI